MRKVKKIIHLPGSINSLPKDQRIKRMTEALAKFEKLTPSDKAFVNLDPYVNLSRQK